MFHVIYIKQTVTYKLMIRIREYKREYKSMREINAH